MEVKLVIKYFGWWQVEAKLAAENEYIVTKRLPPLKMPDIEVIYYKSWCSWVVVQCAHLSIQYDFDPQCTGSGIKSH